MVLKGVGVVLVLEVVVLVVVLKVVLVVGGVEGNADGAGGHHHHGKLDRVEGVRSSTLISETRRV